MTELKACTELSQKTGYIFRNESLLNDALTHRSLGSTNNERLEFLGDGVLNFVIAEALYKKFPFYSEGDLSRLRSTLVNKDTLAELANKLGLNLYIRLGPGELKSGGHRRASINADALEAVFGAVFLDGGFDASKKLILNLFNDKLENCPDIESLKDPKTRLQELLQSRQYALPQYTVVETTGKAHNQKFTVECYIEEPECKTMGVERSRRKAEQLAASKAFEILAKTIQ